MSYREVIVGGAIFCAIVAFFVVLSMAAEWLGSDQSSVTDVIQLALTPAFLLTAVAALLNVFSTRLGRVADRVHLLSADLQRGAADTEFLSAQLDFLRRRSLILDVAVVLATVGGAATCAAVLVLFLRVAQCGCQCQGHQGHFVRSFWRRDCLHTCSVGYISNRNDNGWTWAKGRLPPTSDSSEAAPELRCAMQ